MANNSRRFRNYLAEIIKKERRVRDFGYIELSKLTGINAITLFLLEHGSIEPTIRMLCQLVQKLNIQIIISPEEA